MADQPPIKTIPELDAALDIDDADLFLAYRDGTENENKLTAALLWDLIGQKALVTTNLASDQLLTAAFNERQGIGEASIPVTDDDVTLTAAQYSRQVIAANSTLTGNRAMIFPADAGRIWLVRNNTSGAFTLTLKTAAGTGPVIAQGETLLIRADGTDIVRVDLPVDTTNAEWLSKAVGEVVYLPTDLAGVSAPPTNDPRFRYALLTAGQDGVGQYNEGILTNEVVSGTAPLVRATADVSLAGSTMNGDTLDLLNTENRHLRAGTSPGAVANDQMQQITGEFAVGSSTGWVSNIVTSGAFNLINSGAYPNIAAGQSGSGGDIQFDSANSPDARTGDHTDVKLRQVTAYQRIL